MCKCTAVYTTKGSISEGCRDSEDNRKVKAPSPMSYGQEHGVRGDYAGGCFAWYRRERVRKKPGKKKQPKATDRSLCNNYYPMAACHKPQRRKGLSQTNVDACFENHRPSDRSRSIAFYLDQPGRLKGESGSKTRRVSCCSACRYSCLPPPRYRGSSRHDPQGGIVPTRKHCGGGGLARKGRPVARAVISGSAAASASTTYAHILRLRPNDGKGAPGTRGR